MVGFNFGVHNGREHLEVLVTEDMVGHRLGEFSHTKKFHRHGGKMQKELDTKQKEAEINAAQSAKASIDTFLEDFGSKAGLFVLDSMVYFY
jgi:small subunit ribosomal protein S19